jgi:hypothetical protein
MKRMKANNKSNRNYNYHHYRTINNKLKIRKNRIEIND